MEGNEGSARAGGKEIGGKVEEVNSEKERHGARENRGSN